MSCEECERKWQTLDETIVIRVGRANVHIIACQEHGRQLIEIYRRGLDAPPS